MAIVNPPGGFRIESGEVSCDLLAVSPKQRIGYGLGPFGGHAFTLQGMEVSRERLLNDRALRGGLPRRNGRVHLLYQGRLQLDSDF
jgi:hypothetical protein